MATDIRALVRKEIARLREAVAREESILVSLKDDLKTREAIHRLLSGGATPGRPSKPAPAKRTDAKKKKAVKPATPPHAKRADAKEETAAKPAPAKPAKTKPAAKAKPTRKARPAKQKPVDWEAVLGELPDTFTTGAAAETSSAGGVSPRQAAMAVARWVKAGRIQKLERGKYRKA